VFHAGAALCPGQFARPHASDIRAGCLGLSQHIRVGKPEAPSGYFQR
jgi:hypothetical protein